MKIEIWDKNKKAIWTDSHDVLKRSNIHYLDNEHKYMIECMFIYFKDVVIRFLTTDDIRLNPIDADDPEVCQLNIM